MHLIVIHFGLCREGRPMNDNEVAGMLIGLLLAGQHTSSTTSAWLGFFLARDKVLQERCYAEQKAVCGDLPPLDYDQVRTVTVGGTNPAKMFFLSPKSLPRVTVC